MDPDEDKSLIIFGRDISKIPCFRNSFLYGISGGIGSALAYFLFTSKTRTATNFGFTSFTVITFAYWIQCRYNYSKTKFEMSRLQTMLRNKNLYEGTALDEEFERTILKDSEPVDA